MTTAVKAVYENGVFRPKEPVDLQEKTEVEVLLPDKAAADAGDPTGWKAIDSLRGIIKDAPPDMGENHDFYLYGRPRR
jgi:predicted DNA-binding antitoxin AbrB/MazE fold protein